MGRIFDATASYFAIVIKLSMLTLATAGLMLMPRYEAREAETSGGSQQRTPSPERL